jgi:uncharacterized protein
MKKITLIFSLLLSVLFSAMAAAQDIPDKPSPPRLVNDFAGMLNPEEINSLERKLDAYNDSTSTQIAIVIVKSLDGYDKSEYAIRLGEKWGVGQKGKNNGILILVKPKTDTERGEVFIADGYGLEGAMPDLKLSDIINNQILPAFRQGNYYEGLDKATDTLMALAKGDFPADMKARVNSINVLFPFIGIAIFILIIIFTKNSGGSNQKHIGRSGLPFWLMLAMMNSGNRHDGSWGGFSGGGGFGGGGGGGFGGFGGGGFGGGGAGGSW